jgi:hypothetical protein
LEKALYNFILYFLRALYQALNLVPRFVRRVVE